MGTSAITPGLHKEGVEAILKISAFTIIFSRSLCIFTVQCDQFWIEIIIKCKSVMVSHMKQFDYCYGSGKAWGCKQW